MSMEAHDFNSPLQSREFSQLQKKLLDHILGEAIGNGFISKYIATFEEFAHVHEMRSADCPADSQYETLIAKQDREAAAAEAPIVFSAQQVYNVNSAVILVEKINPLTGFILDNTLLYVVEYSLKYPDGIMFDALRFNSDDAAFAIDCLIKQRDAGLVYGDESSPYIPGY